MIFDHRTGAATRRAKLGFAIFALGYGALLSGSAYVLLHFIVKYW